MTVNLDSVVLLDELRGEVPGISPVYVLQGPQEVHFARARGGVENSVTHGVKSLPTSTPFHFQYRPRWDERVDLST
jgi:hypothetical protein